ncbi:gfo/Idh/MocA family oxidoreductase [Dysgonomonas sp. 521]|uniref:Gfo/Idh/MocA family protein n=1 Tax=Dysgonomonas sp. 521 TaxID=2302932 RepID=UPI0013D0F9DF|nr:Gfo/Idh/MocA family oxidoreductase [Dysgonomonas sp. 521]NDV95347.1 gfo/Idh/MocA family oxidoreductase [Dysgonomonas sp. 521]
MKIGIIGTGWIAGMLAKTIKGMENVEAYAVASRRQDTADAFAREWGITRAYGSYEAMLDDEQVELVYIATPHSLHYENAIQCILKGKPVLCEKAFTVNAWQAEEVLNLAKEKNVFITEAIWTRYMPLSQKINEILASGVIGYPMMLSANLGYPIADKERSKEPSLAGGTLLDLGVYPVNFASMVFGTEVENIVSSCTKMLTGVDAQNSITITFKSGQMAVLHSSMYVKTDRQGVISGREGHLIVENINNPQSITVVNNNYETVARYDCPPQITGYEYQVYACMEALRNGWLESPYMPHAETVRIMRMMDDLRKEWGVRYPFDR